MSYNLRYSSSRSEVWSWYWRAWRSRLWRIHAAVSLAGGFLMSRLLPGLDDPLGWGVASTTAFVVFCTFSAAFPQLVFKGNERFLTLDATGWSTRIGSKTGAGKWSETVPAYKKGGAIFIGDRRGNAIIVPRRAFSSDLQMDECLSAIRNWQRAPVSLDSSRERSHER